jgi:hypothetical protein
MDVEILNGLWCLSAVDDFAVSEGKIVLTQHSLLKWESSRRVCIFNFPGCAPYSIVVLFNAALTLARRSCCVIRVWRAMC